MSLSCGRLHAAESADYPKLLDTSAETVTTRFQGQTQLLRPGQQIGNWTLMAVITLNQKHPVAAFEDFTQTKGHLILVGTDGDVVDLPKSLEPTFADPATLYHGHTLQEVFNSERDLLAEEILAKVE